MYAFVQNTVMIDKAAVLLGSTIFRMVDLALLNCSRACKDLLNLE